jgi:hypothetical protein
MDSDMNHISPSSSEPHRVGPVDPDLLATAIFLFSEYLDRLQQDHAVELDEGADDADDEGPEIDTREVLDIFSEELGTNVATTLNLYMRVTALFRLLSSSPSLARLAMDGEDPGGALSETALLAAARLDLHVSGLGGERAADFDPREFRAAFDDED